MKYTSTRDRLVKASAAQAITQGLSREGGLFVPEAIPVLPPDTIETLTGMDYAGRARFLLSRFLTDFTEEEIASCVQGAYGTGAFEQDRPAPLAKLSDGVFAMELWHGPTSAFKDLALQILPRLMTVSAKKVGLSKTILVLAATSGDTGKAAMEGFKDVPGTKIAVFYPADGVSRMQKQQMVTQEGENVFVCSVDGNFDDAQTGVKQIFGDEGIERLLDENGIVLSSANSINWGRLAPQIVYYFSVYCDLVQGGEIQAGEKVNFAVPTGNFGNILAAYYAKQMGLPIGRLICASNSNNVLTDFIRTGKYDKKRPFSMTISPSMDILISSNLERLLFDVSGRDADKVASLIAKLNTQGEYTVDEAMLAKIRTHFYGGYCSEGETKATIQSVFGRHSYLCDTHTAVAVKVYEEYVKETGDTAKTVIVSTASPFKFPGSVLTALDAGLAADDEFEAAQKLSDYAGQPIPAPLRGLREKAVRFTGNCAKEEMAPAIFASLGIRV